MLQLHYANRLENLIEPLARAVESRQRRDPLAPVSIIVPNRAVEQFAKYGIAERLGVAANLKFPFLRRYLAEIAEQADRGIRVLEVPRLQVALFECLRGEQHRADGTFKPVRDYVAAGNPASDAIAELRLLELSGRIARLFQEYSISRAAMLRAWSSRAPAAGSEPEGWQRTLWTAVFDRAGAARPEWTRDAEYRWMLLAYALAALTDDHLRQVLPPEIHVFGLASPGRVFLEIFARLGRLTDLFIYALNPCMEFWEDVDTSAAARRDAWSLRTDRIGSALENEEDPFQLAAPADTRALQLWGRPGREYIRMLNELTECDFQPHFSHPAETGGASLLAGLQEDILVRAVEGRGEAPAASAESPASIRLLGAPGVRREVEIIASEIWRLVRDSENVPDRRPLRFHEIAVMIPDSAVDAYLPHIETVFSQQGGIPVEIVGRRFDQESRVGEAIDLLLRLPLGRLTRDEILRLLSLPAIAGDEHELTRERLSAWCEELGIFFGADAADFENTYVPPNLFQWDQALTRLSLGAFMEGERSGVTALYESHDGGSLPLEISEDELPAASFFIRLARTLIADVREVRSHRLSLADWSRLMHTMIAQYVHVSEPADEQIRDRCFEALGEMMTVASGAVGYEIAHAFASELIAEVESQQGTLAGRGVAVGPLGSLRSLPFRTIFVLGLGEAIFPERDRRDPLDLRLLRRHPGDISPPERDRYLFLESILAARERVFFTYVARNAQTGDSFEPSTALRELQFILRSYLQEDAVKGLTLAHPVSRYDPQYFPEIAREIEPGAEEPCRDIVSFDSDARRGARMAALRDTLARATNGAPLPPRDELLDRIDSKTCARLEESLGLFELPQKAAAGADEINLPLAAVRAFLECPLQGAARYALGMVQDEVAEEEATDEPIRLSLPDHTVMLRDAFWAARGDPAAFAREYREAIAIAQMKGRAPAGLFADAAIEADSARFARWIDQLQQEGVRDLARWIDFRIGRADEFARADKLLPAIPLEVRMVGADGKEFMRRVNLYGRAGTLAPSLDAAIRPVIRKDARPYDFLELLVNAIALSAAGAPVAHEFRAIVVGDPSPKQKTPAAAWPRTFKPPAPDAAREYLAGLVGEMMSRAHDYFLPIEAVAAARAALAKGQDVGDAIDNVRINEFASCRSDFGPVRRVRDHFEPPEEDEAVAIIHRRFDLIDAIFEEKGR
ncbi:MAG TPA: exodeoxyribonuclease V subunit gamma [Candidatus Binataceae bacterium]|nr:exodeoxyribonuclease V subunit gamma [Candidatus Binataceae bacterium]